ncbi:MAG: type IV secretion protein DotD [Burkholderiaceae bacterium]|nr:MAG: type IV secretion protein DotD [Burkholderiaceae bacterium]
MKTSSIVLSGVICILSGCATPPPPKPPASDAAQLQLAAAADDVRRSLKQLAEAEQFDKLHATPGTPDLGPALTGLNQTVSMPWNGPIEPILERIAALGGYTVMYVGKRPTLPILVSLGPSPTRAAALLQDVGLQAGDRANVVVDPATKRVGVIYADTGL